MAKIDKQVNGRKQNGRFRLLSRRGCLLIFLVLAFLCLVGAGVSAWSNRDLPLENAAPTQIVPLDKVRLEEAQHLLSSLGPDLWPEFGERSIPVILHYGEISFLVQYPGTPPPAWELVSNDDFLGQTYYRKTERDPQNFALQVGEVWAAGIATKTMIDQFLIQTYQAFLPPLIEPLFPYRLLLQPTETHLGAVAHESFHVVQATQSPARLEAAEAAHNLGESYWDVDPEMRSGWVDEVDLLLKALSAETDGEATTYTRQWLEARQERRQGIGLSAALVDYERWLEWEEGAAKYTEVRLLEMACESEGYQPVPAMAGDPDFKNYEGCKNRWRQENIQLRLSARQEGETRFYQTGLALATLLDRLDEGWKSKVFEEGVFLEDILREAVR